MGRVGRSGGGWGGVEEGGEEWRRVGRSGGKNVLLLTGLSIFGSSSFSLIGPQYI